MLRKIFTHNPIRQVDISEDMHHTYLMETLFNSCLGLLRGLLRLQRAAVLGHRVRIMHRRNLELGRGVTVGDFSLLDCWGESGISLGDRTSIGRFCVLKVSGSLSNIGKGIIVGNNVGIGDFAHIGGSGGVTLGSDTICGPYLSIHPEEHLFSSESNLIRLQGVSRAGVKVGANCWIGAKVTILDGAQVGNGCVIAAGSVVNGKFGDNLVLGGVPARVLKARNAK